MNIRSLRNIAIASALVVSGAAPALAQTEIQ